jgi:hypothetical protein
MAALIFFLGLNLPRHLLPFSTTFGCARKAQQSKTAPAQPAAKQSRQPVAPCPDKLGTGKLQELIADQRRIVTGQHPLLGQTPSALGCNRTEEHQAGLEVSRR